MKAKARSSFLKKSYFIFFSLIKYWKYPTCCIQTNFVMPSVTLGKGVVLREKVKIQDNVHIGDYSFINEYTLVDPCTESIGKFCSISHNVKIGIGAHPKSYLSTSAVFYSKSRGFVDKDYYTNSSVKTIIGHDVLLGANSIVIAGVNVGHGAIVGASSVVTKDVPPYAIVAGVPAHIIGYRFPSDIITQLLKSEWWDLDLSFLIKIRGLTESPELFLAEINR